VVRPPRGAARIEPFLVQGRSNWKWRAAGITVLAVLGVAALLRYNSHRQVPEIASNYSASMAAPAMDSDDEQLLTEVSAINPAMRTTYEKSLRSVNNYIADVKKSIEANPEDEDAREQLMQAYEQKAALYEMALSRAGQ
jgi:hypothetical protein